VSNRLPPIVGNWYSHRDKGETFQVVAVDEESSTIETQDFDGGIDEIEFDEWSQLSIAAAAQPEDWSGPVDVVEPDEFGYTDLGQGAGDANPVESAATIWEQVVEEDELDETPAR